MFLYAVNCLCLDCDWISNGDRLLHVFTLFDLVLELFPFAPNQFQTFLGDLCMKNYFWFRLKFLSYVKFNFFQISQKQEYEVSVSNETAK